MVMNRRKFLSYMGCGCGSILLHSCTSAPITDRKQLKIVSEARLNAKAAQIYEKIKEKEKKQNIKKVSFESISDSLSPIQKSKEIQKEASKKNFDWNSSEDVFEKVYEELNELKSIQHKKDQAKEELGDLFFVLINLAKHLQIDPDIAIESANQKFMSRFLKLEEIAKKRNQNIENANIDDLDELWEEVKRGEKSL